MGCGASTVSTVLDFQKVYTTEGLPVDKARDRRRDLLCDVVYDHLICSRLPDEAQEEMIERMEPSYYEAKAVICREGQKCERFYIVADGTLNVKSATNRLTPGYGVEEIDTLKAGRTFGDVNLVLDQCRHRETVTCMTKVELWHVPLARIPQINKIRDAGTRHLVASRLIAQAVPEPVMAPMMMPPDAMPGLGRAPTMARQGSIGPGGMGGAPGMTRQNSMAGPSATGGGPGMARQNSLTGRIPSVTGGGPGGPGMMRQNSLTGRVPSITGGGPAFGRQNSMVPGGMGPGMMGGGGGPAMMRQASMAVPGGGGGPAMMRQASMAVPGGGGGPAMMRQASMAMPGGGGGGPAFGRQASMAPGMVRSPTMAPGGRASTGAHAGGAGGTVGGDLVTHALKHLGTTKNKNDPFSYLPPAQYGNFARRNSMARGPVRPQVSETDTSDTQKRSQRTTTSKAEAEVGQEKRNYGFANSEYDSKQNRRVMATFADQAEKDWNSLKQKKETNKVVVTPFGRVDISLFKRNKDEDE